jgi:putative Mg2+ transporter-C (MgtC) family protein
MDEGLPLHLDVPETLPALLDAALKLGTAGLLGGLLGLDRQVRNKPLGLRTNMLVAIGSCAFALIVMDLTDLFRRQPGLGTIDPSRVIQGIIEGIGFLGTGAIIQSRGQVVGATTGASIWVVGAIGIACGFGLYLHAALLAAIAFFILTVLGLAESWFERRKGG